MTGCGGSFQRDFYLHLTAGFPTFGFPGGSVVKNPPANAGDSGDTDSILGSRRSPGVGNGNSPVFLPVKFQRQRILVGYSAWGCKESDTTAQLNMQKSSESAREDQPGIVCFLMRCGKSM